MFWRLCPTATGRIVLTWRSDRTDAVSSSSGGSSSRVKIDRRKPLRARSSNLRGRRNTPSSRDRVSARDELRLESSVRAQYGTEAPPSASTRSTITDSTKQSSRKSSTVMSDVRFEDVTIGIGHHVPLTNAPLPYTTHPRHNSLPLNVLRWRLEAGNQTLINLVRPRRRTEPEIYPQRMPRSYHFVATLLLDRHDQLLL